MAIRLVPGDPVDVRPVSTAIRRTAWPMLRHARAGSAGLEAVSRLRLAAAARRFRHLLVDPPEGADRIPHAVPGDRRTVGLRHDLRHRDRRAGRHHRGDPARQLVRSGVMGMSLAGYSMPIFWWGLLLIILFSVEARTDAGLGPHRPHRLLLQAGDRLHADRQPAFRTRRAPSGRRCSI